MKLPQWAVKPKSKKKVIATEKGWVVEETGEVLKSVRGLKSMLSGIQDLATQELPGSEDLVDDSDDNPETDETVKKVVFVETNWETSVSEYIENIEEYTLARQPVEEVNEETQPPAPEVVEKETQRRKPGPKPKK